MKRSTHRRGQSPLTHFLPCVMLGNLYGAVGKLQQEPFVKFLGCLFEDRYSVGFGLKGYE